MKKQPPAASTDPTETLAAIGPVARSSVVDAVSDRLRNEILAGRIAAGSRLPSERELSLALGVNRLTLRAALARLEAMGLVSTRHGSGTEVVSWRDRAGLDALPMVMSSIDRGEPAWLELLTSLLEVRRILVSEAVALAAERHSEEDLVEMQRVAAEQVRNLPDPLAFARGDLAMQRVIVRAARNVGLELILNSFARFPDEQPQAVAELYDRREESVPFYDVLVELVRGGDGESARRTLRAAFDAMDSDWLSRHGHTVACKELGKGRTKAKDEEGNPGSLGTAPKASARKSKAR
ncbi:MAG TPA: GntR family transcriptional regulator [Labilithrix sp.]|jgi:GntR family transcriptional repressor for pyruvate dehydrogenase complex|nr:GntR family transcriptional regulator [Labilithrix sp.]